MNSAIEDIKARTNIVDLVGEYVRLTKAGTNWKGLCPFHHEKSPSFMVNEEKQFWHCFGCAKGGDSFSFIMEIESLGFREALKLLADKTGVQLEEYTNKENENKNKAFEILELATKFYQTQLWKGMGKTKVLGYLKERGLTDESIKQFALGYAPPGWDNILKFLISRGYNIEEINKTGLLVQKNQEKAKNTINQSAANFYDRFRDRIMFPIQDAMGKVIGYSARVAPGGDESQAKYINTPETGIYHKSKALYGINHAKSEIKKKNFTLLVEGNMDVIASHQAGIKNTVAVSGTALTSEQIDILKRYGEAIKMLFDMDSAGEQASERSADLCFQKGINVNVVRLLEGKDAAEVVQKDSQKLLDAVEKSVPAMEYFYKRTLEKYSKEKSEDKKKIASEILKRVKNLSNEIERSHWIKKLAQELDVEEKVIFGVLKSLDRFLNIKGEEKEIETENPVFQKRSEIIRNKIAGLAMSDAEVWKAYVNIFRKNELLANDQLLSYLFTQGPICNFSFDELALKIEDENSRARLQKLYFDAKYQFDNSQSIIEYTSEEKNELIGQYMAEFEKELQKQQLADIIKEIRIAEQNGNKARLNILMNEFTKLSQQLR